MKNYVVWHNCHINETEYKFGIEPCASTEARNAYDTMHRISKASAEKFLQGDWEAVVFTEPAESRVEMFKHSWFRIWDMWHDEPCNILYLDSDTLFLRPTEIFGKFKEYRLFNWTDPKQNHHFENYYNAGVRYMPGTMNDEVWEIGRKQAENWRLDIWDQEQIIFNDMFWSQNISDPHHPELNWQGMRIRDPDPRVRLAHEEWNQCKIEDAHIMHVHGSRSAQGTADLMKSLAQELNLLI